MNELFPFFRKTWSAPGFLGCLLLMVSAAAQGANPTYNVPPIAGSPFSACSYSAPTITCSENVTIQNNDTVNFTGNVNIVMTGNKTFELKTGATINTNGYTVNITTGGTITVGNNAGSSGSGSLNLSGGTINFGTNGQISGTCTSSNCSGDTSACTGGTGSCAAPKSNQTITFGAQTSPRTYSTGGTFAISPTATASSGLAVTYSSTTTGVCTVSGTTVTMVTAGTCTIAADQAGNTSYNAAPQVTRSVTINKANQTITFGAQTSPLTYSPSGTFAINPTATASSGLTVTYSSTTTSVCTVSGTTVTMVTAGTCTIAADQAGNANYNAATQVTQSVVINPLLLGDWRMDETSWNGTANEVVDSSGNGNHGTARIANGSTAKPTTAATSKAYTSGSQSTCSYGQFDTTSGTTRTYTYVALSNMPTLPTSFTFAAWIRSTNASQSGQRILVRDDADNGWGFSLGDPGQARIRFFNRNITNSGSVTGDGMNPNCGVFCLDTAAVITSNNWFYVAVAIDTGAKTITLYVYDQSGTLLSNTSSAFSGTWVDGTGTAAIGGETSASSEGRQSSFHFNGNIDEMQIYSGVLPQSTIKNLLARVRTCATSGIDHIRIEHDGNGSTCAADSITLKACATADCSMLYLGGGVTGTLQPFGTAFTIGTSGSVSVSVSPTTAGASTLSVGSVSPTPTNAADCLNTVTSSASCSFPVSACPGGANFDCLETAITPYATGTSRLYTKLAGTGFSFDVVALNSTGAVETNYVGTDGTAKTVTVQLVDASSNVLGTQTATFSAGNTTGRTTAPSFTISSASASVGCKVTDSVASKVGNSVDRFAIRPTVLTVTSPNATNTSSSGSPTFKAGSDSFNLTATAVAGYNGTPAIDNTKLDGTTNAGTISGSFSAANNATGVAIGNAFTYSEVGNFGLQANAIYDASFTSVDSASDCTADFSIALVGGKYGCKIGSTAVAQTTGSSGFGRFIPDHFGASGAIVNRSDLATPGGTFTYMGEPFKLTLTLTAYGAGSPGIKTNNYAGSYAKLDATGLGTGGNWTNTSCTGTTQCMGLTAMNVLTNLSSRLEIVPSGTWATVTDPTVSWTDGVGTVTANVKLARATTPDGPYDALFLSALPRDADGVTMTSTAVGSTKIRFGQMVLFPGYGSELVDLAMPIQTQYWNGSAFAINALDSLTATTGAQVGFTGLTPTKIAPTAATPLTFSSGTGALKLNSSGAVGTAQVTIGLSSMPYLRGSLAGATGYTSDPSAPAVFGLYKKSNKVIFSRERY